MDFRVSLIKAHRKMKNRGIEFTDILDMHSYLLENWDKVKYFVTDFIPFILWSNFNNSYVKGDSIYFNKKMLNELTLCHELAHVGQPAGPHQHNKDFVIRELSIVKALMGEDAAEELRTLLNESLAPTNKISL